MSIIADIERNILDYVLYCGKHITCDIDSKNLEEYCKILKNFRYIRRFLLNKSYIRREFKKIRIFCHEHLFGVELIVKDEYLNSSDYRNELIYIRVLRENENIQYLLEHFDKLFKIYCEDSKFIYMYFQRHRNTRFQFPNEEFVHNLIENEEGTNELNSYLKNGIRSLRHYVETRVLIHGLAFHMCFLHNKLYVHETHEISVFIDSLSNASYSYEIEKSPETIILDKNKGFYYIHEEEDEDEEEEIYIEDNPYIHEDYSQIGNEDCEEKESSIPN